MLKTKQYKASIIIILIVVFSLNARAQNIRDSINILIKTEKNDSIIIDHMLRCLRDCKFNDEDEIESYFNKILKLAKRRNSDNQLLLTYYAGATQFSISKKGIDKAKNIYKILLKLAEEKQNLEFIAYAHIGLNSFLANEGKTEQAKKGFLSIIGKLRNSNLNTTKALAFNELSHIYRNESQFDEANLALDTIINLLKEDSLSEQLSSAYSGKGRIFRFLGKNDSAKYYYKLAEKIALANKRLSNQAVIYNNLGNISHIQGDYDEALKYYFNSIQIKEQTGDFRGLCIGYHNIGAIYVDMKDWEKALKNFEQSNGMAKEIDFKVLMVHNENKIGDVYLGHNDYNKALEKHQQALKYAEESNFSNGYTNSLYKIGNTYLQKQEYLESNTFLIRALKQARETKNTPIESATLVALAENYVKAPKEKKNNFSERNSLDDKEIHNYLLSAKEMADKMNNVETKLKVLEGLILFYSSQNEHKKNVGVLKEYNALKDTLFANDRIKAVADWETKYETAKKEKEILQLENDKKVTALKSRQFKFIVLGSGVFLFGLLFFTTFWARQKRKKREAKKREVFRAKLSSDLHDDVGSTLTGLAMQSELLSNFVDGNLKKNAENIASMSREAMTRMRDTVWAIDSRKDKVDDLIGRMQDFAQSNLIAKDIIYKLDADNIDKDLKIEPELRQNVYLIFKECIANILKHSNASEVKCKIMISDKKLSLSIIDNGKIDASPINTSGIGMTSIKDRAKALNGTIKIDNQNGFGVELMVSL